MAHSTDNDRDPILRILDANANRAAEGVRVIEEIARFSLRDENLTARLKAARHEIRLAAARVAPGAIERRESETDVGRGSATASELARGSLEQVARANFARSEEALRVLEEFGKLVDAGAALAFKRLRFELYVIERLLVGSAAQPLPFPKGPFFYPILDRSLVAAERVAAVAADLAAGGAGLLQYRAKGVPRDEARRDLVAVLAAARAARVPVVVNDDVELAVEVGADGAHVGGEDASSAEARAMLGPRAILGVTIYALAELDRLPPGTATYVAVGPVYPSPTKPEAPVAGLEAVREAKRRSTLPVVAIGGITPANAAAVVAAGADGVCAVSAVLRGDVRKNCFTFAKIIGTKV